MNSPQGHMRGKSSGGGSVRRARERMEAGLPAEMPNPPRQNQPRISALEGPRPAPPPPSGPRPILKNAIPPSRNLENESQPPVGMAISRPTPAPQWPLPAGDKPTDKFVGDKEYQPPPGRSIPPQRPPRPSHVPSILDASKLQDRTAAFPYIPQQRAAAAQQITPPEFQDEDLLSPVDVYNPKSPSSRPSTFSSVGTIPDFPIPAIPPTTPGRKPTNLGPPPSARRGVSSYYSQASFVSPIPEESDISRSHRSYASSAAIPSSWGSSSPAPYYEGEISPGLSDYSDFEIIEEGPGNQDSRSDDGDESGLVRKASMGKRGKPSLISTRNSERNESITPHSLGIPDPMPTNKSTATEDFGQAEMKAAIANATTPQIVMNEQRHTKWPSVDETNTTSTVPANTAPSLDRANTQSSETVPTLHNSKANDVPPMPLMPPPISLARADSATIGFGTRPPMEQRESSRFSRLSAIRRPPRLDLDAVREAEARGSLTSLPDLIKRATRLAAMMDSGKRPGSRLHDLNDFPSDMELGDEKEFGDNGHSRRRSGLSMLSDILSAFPPPGLGTPRNQTPRGQRPTSQWPDGFSGSPLGYEEGRKEKPKKQRKTCCGMSMCCFIFLILIGLIIIAAAVVIPLELLVLNKHKSTDNSSSTTSAASISSCEATLTCLNGGTNSITSGVCSCICTNGFTGSTCAVAGSTGCTTANFTNYSNVTIGEAIPRLISDSQTNFSIPLTSNIIISRFNSDNLTCTSENALVTFNGADERTGSSNTVSSSSSSTSAAAKAKRSNDYYVTDTFSGAATTTSSAMAVATSNGIVYEPSATTSGSVTSTASTAKASATFAVTQDVLDFARVAVLYVLEKKTVDTAVIAQSELQSFFTSSGTNSDASNVTIGTGYTVDLVGLSIDLGNGTVGGTGKTLSRRSRILR